MKITTMVDSVELYGFACLTFHLRHAEIISSWKNQEK